MSQRGLLAADKIRHWITKVLQNFQPHVAVVVAVKTVTLTRSFGCNDQQRILRIGFAPLQANNEIDCTKDDDDVLTF